MKQHVRIHEIAEKPLGANIRPMAEKDVNQVKNFIKSLIFLGKNFAECIFVKIRGKAIVE